MDTEEDLPDLDMRVDQDERETMGFLIVMQEDYLHPLDCQTRKGLELVYASCSLSNKQAGRQGYIRFAALAPLHASFATYWEMDAAGFIVAHNPIRANSCHSMISSAYSIDGRKISGFEMVLAVMCKANPAFEVKLLTPISYPIRPFPISDLDDIAIKEADGNPVDARSSDECGVYTLTANSTGKKVGGSATVQSFHQRLGDKMYNPSVRVTENLGHDDQRIGRYDRIAFPLSFLGILISNPRPLIFAAEMITILLYDLTNGLIGMNTNLVDPGATACGYTWEQLHDLWNGVHETTRHGENRIPRMSGTPAGRSEIERWIQTHIINKRFWPGDGSPMGLMRIIRKMAAISDDVEYDSFPKLHPYAFQGARPRLGGPRIRAFRVDRPATTTGPSRLNPRLHRADVLIRGRRYLALDTASTVDNLYSITGRTPPDPNSRLTFGDKTNGRFAKRLGRHDGVKPAWWTSEDEVPVEEMEEEASGSTGC